MPNLQQYLTGERKEWYEKHLDTAALIRAVVDALGAGRLTGDGIWSLMRLTWITDSRGTESSHHWRTLKIPALEVLFGVSATQGGDLATTVRSMNLPDSVAAAAARHTGLVNFRGVWRNTARQWCSENRPELQRIISDAIGMGASLQERLDVAVRLGNLPRIPPPGEGASVRASVAFSPVVSMLDPKRQFPIINGQGATVSLLTKLRVSDSAVGDQVRHLTGLIGRFGIEDAYHIDVLADKIADLVTKQLSSKPLTGSQSVSVTPLPDYDVEEVTSARKFESPGFRKRHNKMTQHLKSLFPGRTLVTSYDQKCNFDVLIRDYDAGGRDLLIEAKPDPDPGAVRIAIGQLLDYRRFLPRTAATDMAVLTISPPSDSHLELLEELQITAIWYTDESCQTLDGHGRAWAPVRKLLPAPKAKPQSA